MCNPLQTTRLRNSFSLRIDETASTSFRRHWTSPSVLTILISVQSCQVTQIDYGNEVSELGTKNIELGTTQAPILIGGNRPQDVRCQHHRRRAKEEQSKGTILFKLYGSNNVTHAHTSPRSSYSRLTYLPISQKRCCRESTKHWINIK